MDVNSTAVGLRCEPSVGVKWKNEERRTIVTATSGDELQLFLAIFCDDHKQPAE